MISNLLYRGRDPTRTWVADPSRLEVDIHRCTLCGAPLAGDFRTLEPLGPTANARRASRGYLEWDSTGVHLMIDKEIICDMTILLRPSGRYRAFPGRIMDGLRTLAIEGDTTAEQLVALLGEPWARSNNDWDDAVVLYYEYSTGEVQYAFDKERGTLDSIEFWYEPELSQEGACETYGIDKEFPAAFRRKLPD